MLTSAPPFFLPQVFSTSTEGASTCSSSPRIIPQGVRGQGRLLQNFRGLWIFALFAHLISDVTHTSCLHINIMRVAPDTLLQTKILNCRTRRGLGKRRNLAIISTHPMHALSQVPATHYFQYTPKMKAVCTSKYAFRNRISRHNGLPSFFCCTFQLFVFYLLFSYFFFFNFLYKLHFSMHYLRLRTSS